MKAKMDIDNRPLKVKALECAINNLNMAATPKMANIIYKKWEVFHSDFRFKQAIQEKKLKFQKK